MDDLKTVEDWARRFVEEELRPSTPNENSMPWRVVRSSLVRYLRYHEVDRGQPGRMNRALRNALSIAGFEQDAEEKYPVALVVGSWPEFCGEIDRLMIEDGRLEKKT